MARSYKSWNPNNTRKLYPFLGNHSPKRLGGRRSSANFTGGLKSVRSYAMGQGAAISGLSRASRRPLSNLRPKSILGRAQYGLNKQRMYEIGRVRGKKSNAVTKRFGHLVGGFGLNPFTHQYAMTREPHTTGPFNSFLNYSRKKLSQGSRKKQPNWLLRYRSRQRPRTY